MGDGEHVSRYADQLGVDLGGGNDLADDAGLVGDVGEKVVTGAEDDGREFPWSRASTGL